MITAEIAFAIYRIKGLMVQQVNQNRQSLSILPTQYWKNNDRKIIHKQKSKNSKRKLTTNTITNPL
jgi:hypothetical protein